MIPLPEEFTSNGFRFKQLIRLGQIAVFEKSKPGISSKFYEVVIIQRHDGYSINGKEALPAEFMPKSESWGKLGWSFSEAEDAFRKYHCLVERNDPGRVLILGEG